MARRLASCRVPPPGDQVGTSERVLRYAVMAASIHPAATSRNAGAALPGVSAPTLLMVGRKHVAVLDLNRATLARLQCGTRLEIGPRGGHLFEQPGALNAAIGLAPEWFVTHWREEAAA
jgi:putative phosphoribosyl transferase